MLTGSEFGLPALGAFDHMPLIAAKLRRQPPQLHRVTSDDKHLYSLYLLADARRQQNARCGVFYAWSEQK